MGESSADKNADAGAAALLRALHDAVDLFTELQIPYALVGGIAAMTYGRSRFTEDVDLVAAARHQEVLAAHIDVVRAHHFDPVATWKLYHDSGIEIDIWKDEHSDGIAARAVDVQFGDRMVRVAEVHDLLAMKLRAARPQDDYDVSEILKRSRIDEVLLRQRVTAGEFTRFIAIKSRTSPESTV